MSDMPQPGYDRMLEGYIDGTLSADERRAFEQRMQDEPSLRRDVARQEQVNAALRRRFAQPDVESILSAAAAALAERAGQTSAERARADSEATPATQPVGNRSHSTQPVGNRFHREPHLSWMLRLRRAAIAAGLLLAVGGGAYWAYLYATDGALFVRPADAPRKSFGQTYDEIVAAGFKPKWTCRDNRDLASIIWTRFGQALLIAGNPPTVRNSGISYPDSISRRTACLLAEVEGVKVLVFVDRLSNDGEALKETGHQLHVHRRVIDELVCYEVSPLPEPHLLDLLYHADMPEEWKTHAYDAGR